MFVASHNFDHNWWCFQDIGTADGALLSQLCDHFLPALITSSQLLVYTTTTECDRRHGYTTGRRRGYAESLCLQVHADLVGLMENVNRSESSDESQCSDALARAQAEQEELCHILSQFYDIIRPEEEKVHEDVETWYQCNIISEENIIKNM